MDSLIVAVAQYLLFLILAAAAIIWLILPRPDKAGLAIQAVLLAASIMLGAARMAAHVHHGQDIVAGLLIAVLAAGIAAATWWRVRPRLPQRLHEQASA